MSEYFCYDPDGDGFEFFDEPEKAKRKAEQALAYFYAE